MSRRAISRRQEEGVWTRTFINRCRRLGHVVIIKSVRTVPAEVRVPLMQVLRTLHLYPTSLVNFDLLVESSRGRGRTLSHDEPHSVSAHCERSLAKVSRIRCMKGTLHHIFMQALLMLHTPPW
ncbi:hypothetical protein, variant 4 [Cryptococcus amylolentus CBS 6039]|uniref:Uncharacterized protein n=1 Tax=Cryptococcus amylolentus CBS 6039 TaxID=1295533 RepID=A0A1E3HBQ8_9TREE|nr:hypothetical protein, variant 3 [Cryptococcus amylolentus CBS 6039]XP_018989633.1 hypothetical protein, variant 4 [Cryptococcus amylolentus CBS 6039]ODN73770.1 hypothetical protein, variant 3 [Cryptococcus amylolentus CBS 6039]ODN73771.1 hypothetical protein, variant 4 [Cryptococcus amylolentus CBS 6039]